MERVIKFKAKSIIENKWLYGSLVKSPLGTYIEWYEDSICNREEVKPFTVCQFTGMKDKNGVEIWEHDILAYSSLKGEVVFSKSSFCFRREDNGFDYTFSILCIMNDEICYSHIIGNKFDGKKNKEEK